MKLLEFTKLKFERTFTYINFKKIQEYRKVDIK